MKRRGEWRLSRALEAAILVFIVLFSMQVLSGRDPYECRAEGRRLTDEELARASLLFRRGDQFEPAFTPIRLPEGYDLTDVDAVLADPRFSVNVTREGDGPGGVLQNRSWLERQIFGERLAVSVGLPADVPGAPMLWALHVSDACGNVREDHSYMLSDRHPTPPRSETE